MSLFISATEESGKIINASYFSNEMLMHWPQTKLSIVKDPMRHYGIEWEITDQNRYLTGRLSRKEDVIVFEFSDSEFGFEFIFWAYQHLLTKTKIILYDESYCQLHYFGDDLDKVEIYKLLNNS